MDKANDYVAGIDLGTRTIRVVAGNVEENGNLKIVGFGEAESAGMKQGMVNDLEAPARAINDVLRDVDRITGYEIKRAVVNVNGSHIMSTKTEGVIVAGGLDHAITYGDIDHVNEVAVNNAGATLTNRRVLELAPFGYAIDGAAMVKRPLEMTGSKLEVKANAVSGLKQYVENVERVVETAQVDVKRVTPGILAAAKAVLNPSEIENGVALIDIGFATTSVAVFEGDDLQYVAVIPVGSNMITKDLAVMLATPMDVAEEIKVRFASAMNTGPGKDIVIKRGREEAAYSRAKVQEIVEATLTDDIFGSIRTVLKRSGYDRRLPEGVVLIGGGANMRDIDEFAKSQLELAARIGKPVGVTGLSVEVSKPEWATAVGLAKVMLEEGAARGRRKGSGKGVFGRFLRMVTGG